MSTPTIRLIGLVLAAGRGRRMGQTKQLVPWPAADGVKPLVAAAYDAVRPICDDMIVVLGHESEAVAAALAERPFHPVYSDPDADMIASIRAGLQTARRIDAAAAVVLQPGDHPEVATKTLHELTAAAAAQPGRAVMPEHNGRGGHPVIIPPSIIDRVLQDACANGLARFWNDHGELCWRVSVDDASVVCDIDTADQLPG